MIPQESFQIIERLIASHPAEVTTAGSKSDALIERAEAFLDVRFPPSYREFLRRWGAMGFGPEEIYGITGDNFEAGTVPNGIWFTAHERTEGLPHRLVVVGNADGDEYYCIETDESDKSKEVPVVTCDVASQTVIGSKARSFDDFLLVRLQEAAQIIEAS